MPSSRPLRDESQLAKREGVFAREGQFRVIRKLGSGSHGPTFLCRVKDKTHAGHSEKADGDDGSFSGLFVLNTFAPVLSPSVNERAQFEAFFRAMNLHSLVKSEHVVTFFEKVREPDLLGYTVEYLPGGTLEEGIFSKKVLGVLETLSLLFDLSSGLSATHQSGALHRGLTPSACHISAGGKLKLGGFARACRASGRTLAPWTPQLEDLYYQAPEALEHGCFSEQSDIYAVGAIGFFLLTGVAPFGGSGPCAMVRKKLEGRYQAIREIVPECPEELASVLERCLRFEVQERFRTAGELAEEFKRVRTLLSQRERPHTQRPHLEQDLLLGGNGSSRREQQGNLALRTPDARVGERKRRHLTNHTASQFQPPNDRRYAVSRQTVLRLVLLPLIVGGILLFLWQLPSDAARKNAVSEPPSATRRAVREEGSLIRPASLEVPSSGASRDEWANSAELAPSLGGEDSRQSEAF